MDKPMYKLQNPSVPGHEPEKATGSTQTSKVTVDVRQKISHKTSALNGSHLSLSHSLMSKEKQAKYKQLYKTFKKSLGISDDLKSKEEFDAAFENLIGSLDKKKSPYKADMSKEL